MRSRRRFPRCHRSATFRFNHRMVGGWKGPLWVTHPTPCPSRVTQSRLHSTAARGVGISPEKETPQPPWAAWARAPAPSEGRSSSSGSARASSASVCARCPLSCRWALLKRAWLHPPDTHPADICKYILGPLNPKGKPLISPLGRALKPEPLFLHLLLPGLLWEHGMTPVGKDVTASLVSARHGAAGTVPSPAGARSQCPRPPLPYPTCAAETSQKCVSA